MTLNRKRVKVTLQCPNPLFEQWLLDWRDEAREKNWKNQHTYSLALESLRKYPLPLDSGRDCKILKGFGNKMCEQIDNALKKYNDGELDRKSLRLEDDPKELISNQSLRKKKEKKGGNPDNVVKNGYVPVYKSGPYAILIALYKASLERKYEGFMYKKDLIQAAQPMCDSSFTKKDPGSFYTAWNSMQILINKGLVIKESNPAKYSLSNDGIVLGHKLHVQSMSQDDNILTNSPNVKDNRNELQEDLSSKFKKVTESAVSSTNSTTTSLATSSNNDNLKNMYGTCYQDEINDCNALEIKDNSNSKHIVIPPNSFDIILYVDTQETSGKKTDPLNDPIIAELNHLKVKYEVKNLKVGDYCWICRDKISKVELVIPYIIERKRMDDLAGSIKDGRFYEQKFRLRQCGIQNVIYMIESYGKKDEHVGLPFSSLYQAAVNTLIQDGFCVKFVEGVRGVAEYLSCLSELIRNNYEKKTIASCDRDNIGHISIEDDLVSLMFFTEFNKLSTKTKNFNVREMFIKQLLQIKGVSTEKAIAIVDAYPTPQAMRKALSNNISKNVNLISNLKYGKFNKKIGPVLGNVIYQLFTKDIF